MFHLTVNVERDAAQKLNVAVPPLRQASGTGANADVSSGESGKHKDIVLYALGMNKLWRLRWPHPVDCSGGDEAASATGWEPLCDAVGVLSIAAIDRRVFAIDGKRHHVWVFDDFDDGDKGILGRAHSSWRAPATVQGRKRWRKAAGAEAQRSALVALATEEEVQCTSIAFAGSPVRLYALFTPICAHNGPTWERAVYREMSADSGRSCILLSGELDSLLGVEVTAEVGGMSQGSAKPVWRLDWRSNCGCANGGRGNGGSRANGSGKGKRGISDTSRGDRGESARPQRQLRDMPANDGAPGTADDSDLQLATLRQVGGSNALVTSIAGFGGEVSRAVLCNSPMRPLFSCRTYSSLTRCCVLIGSCWDLRLAGLSGCVASLTCQRVAKRQQRGGLLGRPTMALRRARLQSSLLVRAQSLLMLPLP